MPVLNAGFPAALILRVLTGVLLAGVYPLGMNLAMLRLRRLPAAERMACGQR